MRCQRKTFDGYQCRFYRFHRQRCEIGGVTFVPHGFDAWNDVLKKRMQRGFEAELAERRGSDRCVR